MVEDRGTTIAGIFVVGVLMVFALPYVSHYFAQFVSYVVTASCVACEAAGSCTCASSTVVTPLGSVEVRIPSIGDYFLSSIVQYSSQLLLLILSVTSRIEVVAAAFAVDLVSYALEVTED